MNALHASDEAHAGVRAALRAKTQVLHCWAGRGGWLGRAG